MLFKTLFKVLKVSLLSAPKPLACTSIDESSLWSQYRGRPHSHSRILGIILVIKLNISTPLTYPHDIFSFYVLAKLLRLTLWSFLLKGRISLFLLTYSLVSLLTQEV